MPVFASMAKGFGNPARDRSRHANTMEIAYSVERYSERETQNRRPY